MAWSEFTFFSSRHRLHPEAPNLIFVAPARRRFRADADLEPGDALDGRRRELLAVALGLRLRRGLLRGRQVARPQIVEDLLVRHRPGSRGRAATP